MTEYTGWDAYVERKRRGEQLKQIKEEWKDAVNLYSGMPKLPEGTLATEDFVIKQVNSLYGDICKANDRINKITDCGHGKLKQMVTPLHQANVIGRIEALEEWRKQHVGDLFHHGVEEELEDRVKELEEWKISQLGWISRLQQLENTSECRSTEVYRRIKTLEEWKNRYDVDFTHDFQWKTSALERVESLEHRVQELEGYPVGAPSALTTRVKRLEEWKQDICNWGDKKVIDKQDWEYIKESVSNLIGVVHAEPGSRYDVLIKAIQKVDPEFCPND